MLTTTIRRTFTHNGESSPVPPDVLARVGEADQVLKEQLKNLEDIPITGEWFCEMPQHGVWEVVLRLVSEGVPYTHTFHFTDLILPRELRQNVRGAVFGFTRTMTGDIRKQLRRFQDEMKQFIAEGKE